MEKVFRLKDLDCANCAAKMERSSSKIKGVKNVRFNFLTQKLTIDIDGDVESVMDEVEKVCRKVEPDCKIIR